MYFPPKKARFSSFVSKKEKKIFMQNYKRWNKEIYYFRFIRLFVIKWRNFERIHLIGSHNDFFVFRLFYDFLTILFVRSLSTLLYSTLFQIYYYDFLFYLSIFLIKLLLCIWNSSSIFPYWISSQQMYLLFENNSHGYVNLNLYISHWKHLTLLHFHL